MKNIMLLNAVKEDIKDNIPLAIKYYQDAITDSEDSFLSNLNLAIIYWGISFDYGLEAHYISKGGLSEKDVLLMSESYEQLLDKCKEISPNNPEGIFWSIYIGERIRYDNHTSVEQMFSLYKSFPDYKVPLFYLYCFTENHSGITEDELNPLITQLESEPTFKNRHILSYIKG